MYKCTSFCLQKRMHLAEIQVICYGALAIAAIMRKMLCTVMLAMYGTKS